MTPNESGGGIYTKVTVGHEIVSYSPSRLLLKARKGSKTQLLASSRDMKKGQPCAVMAMARTGATTQQ